MFSGGRRGSGAAALISLLPLLLQSAAPLAGSAGPSAAELGGSSPAPGGGEVTVLGSGAVQALRAVDWGPSGVALLAGEGGAVLLHTPPDAFSAIEADAGWSFHAVAFRPSGPPLALLAGVERDGAVDRGLLVAWDGSGLTRLDIPLCRELRGIAWAPDGSAAYIVGNEDDCALVLEFRGGYVMEALSDGARRFTAMCRGGGLYFIGAQERSTGAPCVLVFDGREVVGGVSIPGASGTGVSSIAWSERSGVGLCAAGGSLYSFNQSSAFEVPLPFNWSVSSVAWSPRRELALLAGRDAGAQGGGEGLLCGLNSSGSWTVSSGHPALLALAWEPSGSCALAAGENGTVLRYVPPNSPPVCTISSPGAGDVIGGVVLVSGAAADPDGDLLDPVEVRVDDGPWELASGADGWSFLWDTTKVPSGGHTIFARAFDGLAHSVEDSRLVIVSNPNRPPSVAILEPAEGAGVAGEVIVRGWARDPDAGDGVEEVRVAIDEGPWAAASGAESWSYVWNTTALPDGPHTIRSRAWDGESWSEEAVRNVTVQNLGPNSPPVCTIATPSPGEVVTGVMRVSGTARDEEQGVRAVWVRVDEGEWRAAEGAESWHIDIDTEPLPAGPHAVFARASDGIVNSSEARVTFTVNHPPVCGILRPSEGETLVGEVELSGYASDPDPGDSVVWVEVRVDDGRWLRATGTESWSFVWRPSSEPAGHHTLWARCYDGHALSVPARRSVTLEKPPQAVALMFPVDVGEDYVFLQWSQNSDADFARYEVFCSETEGAPLSGLTPRVVLAQSVTVYNYTGLRPATGYWFRVRVVDTYGLSAVSNEVWATTLEPNTPPVAHLSASRTRVRTGETVTFNAGGSYDPDRGGRIVRFEWDFEGRGRFPVDTGLVQVVRHSFGRAGRYAVQLRVTDERGASSTASVNVTVLEREEGLAGPWLAASAGALLAALALAALGWRYLAARAGPASGRGTYERLVRAPAEERRRRHWGPGVRERGRGRKGRGPV
ncbi:MAG: Ig-like domain-containing protein [Thermoplasmata archaeon]